MDQKEINKKEWENTESWSGGLLGFYFSKKDTRIWVPKSNPKMGWTVNTAHPAGPRWIFFFLLLPFFILLTSCLLSTK